MRIKRRQVLEIDAALGALAQQAKGVKLSYAIAKNRSALRSEIEAIQEADKPSEAFKAFEERRITTAKAHALKDEKGQPKVQGTAFILEDPIAFEQTLSIIREQHKPAIEEREKQIKELNKLLDEYVDVSLYHVKLESIETALPPDAQVSDLLIPLVGTIIDDE